MNLVPLPLKQKMVTISLFGQDYIRLEMNGTFFIFLAIFIVCFGSKTPSCTGELDILLVPTPLVSTVKYLVKCSLLKFVGLSPPLKTS